MRFKSKILSALLLWAFCLSWGIPSRILGQAIIVGNAKMVGNAILSYSVTAPTFSLVQGPGSCGGTGNCECTISSTSSCTITLNTAIAAGNLAIFLAVPVSSEPPDYNISSVSNGGSIGTLSQGYGCSTGMWDGGVAYNRACAYVLPANNTGGTGTSLTVTFSGTTGGTGYATYYEWKPSANGSSVGLDNDGSYSAASAATQDGPPFTYSGTNDVTLGIWQPGLSYIDISSVNSPYSTNAALLPSGTGNVGFIGAISTTRPVYTSASSIGAVTGGLSFGWNVTTGKEWMFTDLGGGGTSGNQPTAALLQSAMGGWQGCQWSVTDSGAMLYNASASFGLQTATGRLYGDGDSYIGGSGLGIALTGTGSAITNYSECNWYYGSPATPDMAMGIWVWTDRTTDADSIDTASIHAGSDYINVVQKTNGSGSPTYTAECSATSSGTSVTVTSSAWYRLKFFYNYGTSGNNSVEVFNSSGTQVGSTMTCTNSGNNYPAYVLFGQPSAETIPSGNHVYYDSMTLTLDGSDPSQ